MKKSMSWKLLTNRSTTSLSKKIKTLEAGSTAMTKRKVLATKMFKHNKTKHQRNKLVRNLEQMEQCLSQAQDQPFLPRIPKRLATEVTSMLVLMI
jgi:hypothetical protein